MAVSEPGPGSSSLTGQNAAGARLKVASQGTRVQIRHAEILRSDGTLYTDNLQGAKCTDVYILKGVGRSLEPAFTYRGFRYAELTDTLGRLRDALVMHVSTPRFPPLAGSRAGQHHQPRRRTSSEYAVQLYSVPTDCPQRDERLGWTGDVPLFLPRPWNMNVAGFVTKWMRDVVDSHPGRRGTDVGWRSTPRPARLVALLPFGVVQRLRQSRQSRQAAWRLRAAWRCGARPRAP